GIRDFHVTGVQTCALPICRGVVLLRGGLLGAHHPSLSPYSPPGGTSCAPSQPGARPPPCVPHAPAGATCYPVVTSPYTTGDRRWPSTGTGSKGPSPERPGLSGSTPTRRCPSLPCSPHG